MFKLDEISIIMAILFVLSISPIWFQVPFELLKAIH